MSHSRAIASGSSSSNFQLIINNALKAYEKKTKRDLIAHPLALQLQGCDSPGDILAVLQQQVQGLDQSQSRDERWTKWLNPTVNVLFAFSATLGSGVGLVCSRAYTYLKFASLYLFWQLFSPASVIFAGIGVLLSVCIFDNLVVRYCNTDIYQAAKDVRASQDTLVDIFERIEMFFRRLEVYTEVPPTTEMTDIIVQIMAEVLSILGIATKEIKQSRISE
jgi:hypothetical protein